MLQAASRQDLRNGYISSCRTEAPLTGFCIMSATFPLLMNMSCVTADGLRTTNVSGCSICRMSYHAWCLKMHNSVYTFAIYEAVQVAREPRQLG